MRALTTTELADILFQKPERITAGILKKRSRVERLRDNVLTWQDKRSLRPVNPGKMEQLRKKLLLHFEAEAKVGSEHQRSLKHAALELKALGFSNKQIEEIKSCCYRFSLSYCEPDAPLGNILHKDYPGHTYAWCDDAFLGAALVPKSDSSSSFQSTEDTFAALDQFKKDRHDPAQTKNTIFTAGREQQAYDLFQEYVAEYVAQSGGASLFLMPAKPHQRYKSLCP